MKSLAKSGCITVGIPYERPQSPSIYIPLLYQVAPYIPGAVLMPQLLFRPVIFHSNPARTSPRIARMGYIILWPAGYITHDILLRIDRCHYSIWRVRVVLDVPRHRSIEDQQMPLSPGIITKATKLYNFGYVTLDIPLNFTTWAMSPLI